MDMLNATDARVSRTLHHNPLLHLIVAASILSKLTHGKAYLQSPWVPFRPIFGYYPQHQIPPLWYPINPFLLPNRLFPQLTTNVPQLQQAPPLNQQQIIHIHEPQQPEFDEYEDSRNKFPQTVSPYQDQLDPSNPSGSNLDEQTALEQKDSTEIILTAANNDAALITENATYNEIPEPPTPYGKPIIESDLEAANSEITVVTVLPDMLVANKSEEIEDILVAAEASNYRRKQRPQYDYDYDEDDFVGSQIRRPKPTKSQNRPQKTRPYKQQGARINSKRGQYRPLTTPYPVYDDEYDQTTPRVIRRRPTQNKYAYRRRTTTPVYDDDEYETRPYYNNKRKNQYNNRNNNRRPPSSYGEYYDDADDTYDNEEIEYHQNRQKVIFRPRQETTEATTTTEGTTETTSEASTSTTAASTSTTVGYPYNNGNVSITYGPPNYHPGYGPSNGNEQVSITYGPPTGSHIGPLLDSWYNQYAKTSVIKRIQELLTPNSYYSPQYDTDKFNYNDDSF